MVKMVMCYFGDIEPFLLRNDVIGPTLTPKLLSFFANQQKKGLLHLEIAATVDWGEPFVKRSATFGRGWSSCPRVLRSHGESFCFFSCRQHPKCGCNCTAFVWGTTVRSTHPAVGGSCKKLHSARTLLLPTTVGKQLEGPTGSFQMRYIVFTPEDLYHATGHNHSRAASSCNSEYTMTTCAFSPPSFRISLMATILLPPRSARNTSRSVLYSLCTPGSCHARLS